MFIFFSVELHAQCAQFTTTLACTFPAPTIVGASVSCTPPANNGGRRNFEVTGMVAGCIYQVSNCGSGFDTQLTIFNSTGTAVGFEDDDSPVCAGTAASLNFTCLANGTYNIQLNRFNCSTTNQLNGTITVTLLSCGPPPPPCSDCTNATAINSLPFNGNFTTCGACNSVASGQGCTSNYLGGEDYLFAYTPVVSGNIDIILSGTLTYAGLFIVQGCPTAGGICVANNTNAAGNPLLTSVALTAGIQYYIIVDTWPAPNCTPFTINVQAAAPPPAGPANDLVCNATPITCGQTLAGTTVAATLAGTGEIANGCGGPATQPGVWYSVAGNGQIMTASLCGTAAWDSRVQVFSGADCNTITCVGGNDDDFVACGSFGPASFFWTSEVGVNYYIFVSGFASSSAFSLALTCVAPPAPPANDLICNATAVTCGQTVNGTTEGATITVANELNSCTINNTQPAVWYRIVGNGQLMTVSLCGTVWDSRIRVFSGTCSSLTCVGGNNDSGPSCGGTSTSASYQWLSAVGVEYFISVSGSSAAAAFSLVVNCQTVSGCSGTFTDPGPGANYPPNQYVTTTYCPDNGGRVSLSFSAFDLENGYDYLTVFDGPSTSSTVIGSFTGTELLGLTLSASSSNPSGCLTFLFESDGSGNRPGWVANLSCLAPCQLIQSSLVSSIPALSGGVIRICQGQSVTLNGAGSFSVSPLNANYSWSFNNASPVSGQSIAQTFNTAGTYLANLNIQDPAGCRNSNRLNVRIEVSTTPTILTSSVPSDICLGQSSQLNSSVTMTPNVQSCTPPLLDPTFLPDGANVSYEAPIVIDCYGSNQVIQSISDISSICLNMEHSSLADLDIQIQCPNGSIATLFDNADVGLSSANLGQPVSSGAFDLTLPNPLTPGVGSVYCFSGDGALPTIAQSILAGGSFPDYNGPLPNYTDGYVPGGASLTYEASGGLTPLLGCPLNGQWSIIITDNIRYDNGFIFNWDINFSNAIASSLNFTPTIVSQGWQATSGLTTTAGSSTATVTPTVAGNNCYTYSVTDNFGCTYNQQACVNVINNITATVNSATICSGASATITATPVPAGTYNYAWTVPSGATNPGNVASFNATVAGTYTVVISTQTTPACTSAPASGTLTVGATMTVSANQVTTACHNLPLSPVIVFTTTGATGIGEAQNLPPGLTASFAGNATAGTITISGMPTVPAGGSFGYTIPLTGGCGTANAQGTITVNVPPLVPTAPGSLCAGTSNTLTVSGGTAGSQLSWTTSTGGSGTATLVATAPCAPFGCVSFNPSSFSLGATWPAGASITFIQVSLNGCTVPVNLVVTIASSITAAVTATTPICSGASTTLTFTGTPSAVVTYNIGGGANQLINLGPTGTVSSAPIVLTATTVVTVTQVQLGSNCTQALNNAVTIVVNPASQPPTFSAIGPYCYGVTAPPLPTTSTNNVSGTWSPATVNTNVVGITNYTFTPTGTCPSAPVVIAVTVNERPLVFAHGTNPTCSNLCNGSAVVDVTGGTAPYTYSWSNGGVTATIPNLCVGTYNVTVTDANGCQSQAFTPVSGCFQIQSILVDACSANEYQEEMVFFQVGTAPLNTSTLNVTWPTYAANPPQDPWLGLCSNPAFITNVNLTISGGGIMLPVPANGILPPNSNVVLITSNSTTSTSNSFSNLSDTLYVMFQCAGNLTGHFGNNASVSATRTLTMNFGSGCSDVVAYDVAQLINQNGVAGGVGNAAINNGATVNFSSNGSASYINYGCVAPFAVQDNSITLTAPTPITPTFTPVAPFCSGAAIPALPISSTNTPAITGTWAPAINNTATTTYTFTPTAGLCANTTTLDITINPLPTVTVNSPTICSGGSATVTATPGIAGTYTYAWTVPSGATNPGNVASFSTAVAGSYTVTISTTGTPSCTSLPASGTVTITTPPSVTVNSSTICTGGSATVTATPSPAGTYSYAWTVPSGVSNPGNVASFSASVAGTYSVVVSTSSVPICSSAPVAGTITIAPLPTVAVNSPTVCPGTPATLTASPSPAGTYTYAWTVPSGASNPGNVATFTTTVAGSYSVIATSTGTPACSSLPGAGVVTLNDIIDYANLQFPGTGTICANGTFNAFGQLYNTGAVNTPGAGAAAGVTVQIGYSTTNSDPSTWTNWSAANYNPAVTGNNDEYQGTLSGLAVGTYYYTFRYQINGCSWQYGGYIGSGGGFWNGTCTNCNVNGQLNVIAIPDAGNDATLNLCANGTTLNLYNSLGALAANTGVWTGPSSLTGGYLGTFNPASNTAGVYKYKVSNGTCADSAFVTVVIGAAPNATLTYSSPVCATAPLSLSPIIVGSTGPNPQFAISPTTGVSIGATTGVVTSSGNPTPGTYTVTYTIPENATTGCTAFVTTAQIVVTAAPAVPTLTPASFCANTPLTFTAGNGSVYEFFVNGVSQGTPSSTATFNSAGVAAGVPVCVRSYPQVPVLDGNIVGDAAVWGAPLATSTGGAVSATGNRIDGLFLRNMNNVLYGAVAGAEIDGTTQAQNNRVLLFLDTKPGMGFNSLAAWTNRNGVPVGAPAFQDGIKNLSSGITFDAGFAPDYILAMNCANSNTPSTAYFDLYDMNADVNVYLGSGTNAAGAYGYQANAAPGALDKGFEFGLPMASIGSPTGSFKVFAMLVNDPNSTNPTTVSNQFLTRANPGQNDFGSGNIDFNNEPPNPIVFALGSDCYTETCVSGTAPTTTTVGPLGPLCYGAAATLPTPAVAGSWSPPLIANTTVGTTTYTFTPAAGACATPATLTIEILPQILTTLIFHN